MTKSYNLQWAGYIIRFIATTITISSTSIITFRLMMFNGSCLTSSFHGSFQIKIEKMCYVYIMSSYCFFYPALSLAIAKIATVEIHKFLFVCYLTEFLDNLNFCRLLAPILRFCIFDKSRFFSKSTSKLPP